MAKERITVRWLEISVTRQGLDSWEWQAYAGGQVLACGSETSHMAARFAAYSTYLEMLQGGWS